MRKTIAQRMLQAKQTAPEIHVTVDIRVDKLVAVREDLNRQLAAENIKLSLGDFVTKAVAIALRRHPGLNASYEPDAIVRHGEINIGIAVALDEGLIVPVLHRADTLGLAEIRSQSAALAVAARSSQLTTEHLSGSTFTISNLGMYGISQFDAILNLPEVGILAVAAAETAARGRGRQARSRHGPRRHAHRRSSRRRRRDGRGFHADHQAAARGAGDDAALRVTRSVIRRILIEFPRRRTPWHTTMTSWSSVADPAGYAAAIRAAQLKKRVLCVERDKLGGICLNWGCIPTKALLSNAHLVELIKTHGKRFGYSGQG